MSRRLASAALAVLLLSACAAPAPQAAPSTQKPAPPAPQDPRQAYASAVLAQYNAREGKPAPATGPASADDSASLAPPPAADPLPTHAAPPLAANAAEPAALPPLPDVEWIEKKDVSIRFGPKQEPTPVFTSHTPAQPRVEVKVTGPSPVLAAPASAITPPAPSPAPAAPPTTTDPLETDLARAIRNDPRDLAAHLDYQLVQLLRGRRVPQMDSIASLPAEDHEALCALLDALSRFRETTRADANATLARKLQPLVDLADRLRTQASLQIPAVALCKGVTAFGVYEPLASDRFTAGRENAFIVYCEVDNFSTRLNDRNLWETTLSLEVLLYNDRGQRLHAEERRAVTDLSRNRRRDFFLYRVVRLPATLPPGRYYLKVSVADPQAGRIKESRVSLEIVGS